MRTPNPPSALAQWRGAAQLASAAFGLLTTRIHEFHRAISDKPFTAVNTALTPLPAISEGAAPVRGLHDGITDGVYTAVRVTGTATLDAAARILREAEQRLPQVPAAAHRGRDIVTGAIAGFVGDHASAQRNPLMPRLDFVHRGLPLAPKTESLVRAYPQAGPRLAIFVHGLACTEHSWQIHADRQPPAERDYGRRLEREFGYTPLFVRYNTGLHIARNGGRLARKIDALVRAWPVPVEEIVLIGHSMGGLVIRAAAAQAHENDVAWSRQLRHVICLGSPHRGAPLEQAVDALTGVLGQFELSRPWGRILEARSVGIRDLKHGATSTADWRAADGKRWQPARFIARLPRTSYHFIGSSIGLSADDPLGRFVGDGLVRLPSSLAGELADANTAMLFGLNHMQLLNHRQVYDAMRTALQREA